MFSGAHLIGRRSAGASEHHEDHLALHQRSDTQDTWSDAQPLANVAAVRFSGDTDPRAATGSLDSTLFAPPDSESARNSGDRSRVPLGSSPRLTGASDDGQPAAIKTASSGRLHSLVADMAASMWLDRHALRTPQVTPPAMLDTRLPLGSRVCHCRPALV